MRSMVRTVWLAGAVGAVAAQASAADGVLIVQKVTAGTGVAMTHQIEIEPHRMRVESGGSPGGSQVFIFDGTRQVMLMVNDASKSYSEITKADVDAMSGQVSTAMSQMQEMLKNMPPEQRAKIQGAMRGMGGAGGPAAKTEYRKNGTATVGKWTCDVYDGYANGQKTSELCTVDPKVLGFGTQDFGVTKDFAEFFGKLMPGSASQAFRVGTLEEQGFSGVPIRSIVTTNGQTITSELTDVKRQSFPDGTFQAPAGYAKTDSPFGRGRRGGR
jgi:Domain of unknown function (DUF4412)